VNISNQFLRLMLKAPCNSLRCYGESFVLENGELKYFESCLDYSHDLPNELAHSGRGSSYIDGVGLPGDCKTKRIVEIHILKMLILDGFFDTGGSRLAEFAEVFKLACTIPVIIPKRENSTEFLGVVVLYLSFEPTDLESLQSYLEALVQSMGPSFNLFEKRTAVAAMMSRKNSVAAGGEDIEVSRKVSKISVVSVVSNGSIYKIEIEETVQEPVEPVGKQKRPLSKRLLAEKAVPWLNRYFRKWMGGKSSLPPALEDKYCVATFLGCFCTIAVLQVMFDHINDVFEYRGVPNLFFIPTSFGALSTIVSALPAAPLGQPRIIFLLP